jgi:hypothetical protein
LWTADSVLQWLKQKNRDQQTEAKSEASWLRQAAGKFAAGAREGSALPSNRRPRRSQSSTVAHEKMNWLLLPEIQNTLRNRCEYCA